MAEPINFLEEKCKKLMPQNIVHGGTVNLKYSDTDYFVGAPYNQLVECCSRIEEQNRHQRRTFMSSVNKAIKERLPQVENGSLKDKEFMELSQDITIWYANEIVEDRKSFDDLEFL